MKEGFEKFSLKESGRLWSGHIRPRTTGITEVCKDLDAPGIRLFHNSAKIKAGKVGRFFVKRYNLPGWWVQIRRFFKRSRATVVMHGAAHLEKLAIPTPRVEAALTEWCGAVRREYLVTALLSDQDRFMDELCEKDPETAWQLIMKKLLPMLARLHDSGARHGDLNLRNIYLDSNGEAGLIDLDGMKIGKRALPHRFRAQELGRLISRFLFIAKRLPEYAEYSAKALQSYGNATKNVPSEKTVQAETEKFIRRMEKYL